MIEDISVVLSQIEAALRRLDRQVLLRALRPGLPAGDVRASLGLGASAELEALYGWRDGTATAAVGSVDDIHLFPGFYLMSIEDSIVNYRAFVTDPRWKPGWLPVFTNGDGDFYVVELRTDTESPVRHFRIDQSEHPIEFSSLGRCWRPLLRLLSGGPSSWTRMTILTWTISCSDRLPPS